LGERRWYKLYHSGLKACKSVCSKRPTAATLHVHCILNCLSTEMSHVKRERPRLMHVGGWVGGWVGGDAFSGKWVLDLE
jgi:hypothetical protein